MYGCCIATCVVGLRVICVVLLGKDGCTVMSGVIWSGQSEGQCVVCCEAEDECTVPSTVLGRGLIKPMRCTEVVLAAQWLATPLLPLAVLPSLWYGMEGLS